MNVAQDQGRKPVVFVNQESTSLQAELSAYECCALNSFFHTPGMKTTTNSAAACSGGRLSQLPHPPAVAAAAGGAGAVGGHHGRWGHGQVQAQFDGGDGGVGQWRPGGAAGRGSKRPAVQDKTDGARS